MFSTGCHLELLMAVMHQHSWAASLFLSRVKVELSIVLQQFSSCVNCRHLTERASSWKVMGSSEGASNINAPADCGKIKSFGSDLQTMHVYMYTLYY